MTTKISLYDNTVTVYFDSIKHQYKVDALVVPSVTTVLSTIAKPALINWAANMCADNIAAALEPGKAYDELQLQAIIETGRRAHWQKKTDAGTIGSFVHKFVQQYINGENPALPVNEELKKSVERFLAWVEENKVKFLVSEQVTYSKKHRYIGTLDFICTIGGKMYLGDLKTSNAIYPAEMGLQLAAYRLSREEEFPQEKYAGCILVRVGKKDGEFETWQFEDDSLYRRSFLSALELSRNLNEIKLVY